MRKLILANNGGKGFYSSCLDIIPVVYRGNDVLGYYEKLEVNVNATKEEIKKAAIKAMKENHPDTGGEHDKFCEIQKAAETLLDPLKRRDYDNKKKEVKGTKKVKVSIKKEQFVPSFYKESIIIIDNQIAYKWIETVLEILQKLKLNREVKIGFRQGAGLELKNNILSIGKEVKFNDKIRNYIEILYLLERN